jgi:hypothetical protein
MRISKGYIIFFDCVPLAEKENSCTQSKIDLENERLGERKSPSLPYFQIIFHDTETM